MKMNSKLQVETSYAPNLNVMHLIYQRTEKSPISIEAEFFLNKKFENYANVYIHLKSPNNSIEYYGELKKGYTNDCSGYNINGTVTSSDFGQAYLQGKMCTPAYIELTASDNNLEDLYLVKFGLPKPSLALIEVGKFDFDNQNRFEIAPTEKDSDEIPVSNLMLSVNNPRSLELDMKFDKEAFKIMVGKFNLIIVILFGVNV